MKKILVLACVILSLGAFGQMNKNIGGGYFGHTLTHPGIVLEFELEKKITEKMSLPFRFDLGYYRHPRNHDGLFFDFNFGSRRYFENGLFIEQSIGIGFLETIMNEDVFEVDDNGTVTSVSKFNEPDFMPSITLGLGYNMTKSKETLNALWIRPKIFWQVPHKSSAVFHPVVQFGFTHGLK